MTEELFIWRQACPSRGGLPLKKRLGLLVIPFRD